MRFGIPVMTGKFARYATNQERDGTSCSSSQERASKQNESKIFFLKKKCIRNLKK